ncbi:MAG: oxygen-independent coproporphyrinogen III oxidase [Alphaproteobacteria bacterium]|nr:oxygen-independent coproporphyrinogen III oxidase [Alphaproteobacteria bacterium]
MLASERVPRYTSYPTAPHFHAGIGPADYVDWLADLDPTQPVSLYLHVPFCEHLCWYCGCNAQVLRRPEALSAFADRLIRELWMVADAAPGRLKVTHLHWGGGTPTQLPPAVLERVMQAIADRYALDEDAEVAVEIDPRVMTPAMASTLGRCGFNRASLGVQDFTPHVQAAIGRVQSYDVVARTVDLLRDAGVGQLNFDLMYGLPQQTEGDCVTTVERCLRLYPDRFAMFGYAHVPWMRKQQGLIDASTLPDGDARMRQFESAAARLQAEGFQRVGLDHFALPDDPLAEAARAGRLHRNFQGYTTDPAEVLLAVGPSAIGQLPQGFVQNKTGPRDWSADIDAGRLATKGGIAISADDRQRAGIIKRLMCDFAVDLEAACGGDGPAVRRFAPELARLRELAAQGIVELDGGTVTVRPWARLYVRSVAAVFDAYLGKGPARHSRSV